MSCSQPRWSRHSPTEPIKIAQAYIAALAADGDGALDRLATFLDQDLGG